MFKTENEIRTPMSCRPNRNRSQRRRPFRIVFSCINIFVSWSKLFCSFSSLYLSTAHSSAPDVIVSSSRTNVIFCFQKLLYAFFFAWSIMNSMLYIDPRKIALDGKPCDARLWGNGWDVHLFLFYFILFGTLAGT